MNLTNVARSSITELRKDYEAFLRHNKLTQWPMRDPIRQELIDGRFKLVDDVARWARSVNKREPARTVAEISANIGIVYCMVAGGLLNRQLQTLAREFEANGGFNERLHRIRTEARKRGTGSSGPASVQKQKGGPGGLGESERPPSPLGPPESI